MQILLLLTGIEQSVLKKSCSNTLVEIAVKNAAINESFTKKLLSFTIFDIKNAKYGVIKLQFKRTFLPVSLKLRLYRRATKHSQLGALAQ